MALVLKSTEQKAIAELLTNGAVAVLPTDTVYGLVACAAESVATTKLYALKRRENKPGPVIAANVEQLVALGIRARYLKAVEHYWPNPISVVIPCGDDLAYLHQGQRSLAVRIPADDNLRDLLLKTGPLITSSANQPGEPVAVSIDEAQRYFPEGVDVFVDGGTLTDRPPSTVIRVVDDAIEVLRQGAVHIDESGRINQ